MTTKHIKICSGAGCRAWKADEITDQMKSLRDLIQEKNYELQFVPCMKKCGGGACVQVNPGQQFYKLRKPEEVSRVFGVLPVPAVV